MDIQLDFTGTDCFFLALLCVIVPLDWLLSAVAAAAVHEFCHIAAVRIMGSRIRQLHLCRAGAVLEASSMEPGRELLCSLAGPAGSLLLLALWRWVPKMACWGAVQGIYNLIPVYPLDGGRALQCISGMLFGPEKAEMICRIVKGVVFLVLVFAGFWGIWACDLGFLPVVSLLFLLIHTVFGKIPCKEGNLGVQ